MKKNARNKNPIALFARSPRLVLSASLLALLAACGGGGGSSGIGSLAVGGTGSTGGSSAASQSVTLSGQVVDGPIAGAQVCLFSNGVQARNAAGEAICSAQTDTAGNYVMTIPRNLASGLLTLIAVKGSSIKLASTLGTLEQLLSAAGTAGAVTPSSLSSATVTHLTTASFALADTDHDGIVSPAELAAYVPDFSAVQRAATIIQAYIDGGQSALIGGATSDTLALASAAIRNQPLGTTGQTADDWFDDPDNAQAIASAKEALNAALAKELEGKLSGYRLTETVTQQTIPETVYANGGAASIYCSTDRKIDVPVAFDDVSVAFDAARGVTLLRYTGDDQKPAYIMGAYNPQTGAFSLSELVPKHVVQPGEVTFFQDSSNKYAGTIDAAGNIAGTFVSKSATTWSLDATRQECTDAGTFTMTKR